MKITASNVTYNCAGFNITNNGTAGTTYGILVNGSVTNVTIKNCPLISGYTSGFYILSSNNSAISNSTAFNNTYGLTLNNSNATLTNDTAYNNTEGFYLITTSFDLLTNDTAYNNTDGGFSLTTASRSNLSNDLAFGNGDDGFSLNTSSNSTLLTNDTAYGNADGGFGFSTGINSTITNDTAFNNTNYGFYFNTSSNNNIIANDTAYLDSYAGYGFASSSNNSITNCSAYSNANIGMQIYDSNLTTVQGMHLFNSSPGIVVQNDLATAFIINLTSMAFDNPLGNYQNYTNLSINDSVASGDNYSIKWMANQTAPPYTSFAQTYVNISTISGTPSIDHIVWSWISGQLTGYNSSLFSLELQLHRMDRFEHHS